MNLGRELAIISHAMVVTFRLLGTTSGLDRFPFGAHVGNLGLPVLGRVVVLALTAEALPQTEMLGVDSNTMVLLRLALTDISPATLLFLEIKTGGVGKEDPGQEHTSKTEPRNNVELGLGIDVVVEDGGEESTSLAQAGRETVGSGTDGGRENLTSDEEGDRVGTELVEERGDEVHGLESVDAGGANVVFVVEGRDDKHEEAHQESNLLHHLAAVHLVVDEERGEVVSAQRDNDVDQVPRPGGQERLGVVGNDLDELTLEKLVAVEENVVAEPGTSSSQEATAKVGETSSESVEVVASDVGAGLGLGELTRGMRHLPGSEVNQPESTNGREGKGQTESPLSSRSAVRRATLTLVENDEENNEHDLVDELTPTLHEESHGDSATTVKTVLLGGELSRGSGVFERRGSSDGVFTTDTQAVEEERPSVANDPALEGHAPRGSEHEETDEHDDGVLNETPATADPITNDTNKDLTDHDTNDFEVGDGGDPVLAADLGALEGVIPALGPDLLEERLQVTNGEEDVALETETSTGDNGVAEVPAERRKGILLHHAANGGELLGGSLAVDLVDELEALGQRQVSPVDTFGGVAIVGTGDMAEDGALLGASISDGVIVEILGASRAVRNGDFTGSDGVTVVSRSVVVFRGHRHDGRLCAVCRFEF